MRGQPPAGAPRRPMAPGGPGGDSPAEGDPTRYHPSLLPGPAPGRKEAQAGLPEPAGGRPAHLRPEARKAAAAWPRPARPPPPLDLHQLLRLGATGRPKGHGGTNAVQGGLQDHQATGHQELRPPGPKAPLHQSLPRVGWQHAVAVLAPHKLPKLYGKEPGRQAPSHHPAKSMRKVLVPDTRGGSLPTTLHNLQGS